MIKKNIISKKVNMCTMFMFLGVYAQVPVSPFGAASDICVSTEGTKITVDGFVSSPYKITPFMDVFKNPPFANVKEKACRADGHCMFAYDFNVNQVQLRPFDNAIESCKQYPGTWFLSYNGSIPGPTIKVPTGHESLVRFKNSVNTVTGYFKGSFNPCLPNNGRTGRPFSVHHHGAASLAPYDGWAEDETCFGEVKDYVYPNNRPATEWYHDHALHITADNAYLGMAGLYINSAKVKDGGCGEPWNLEDIQDYHMILADKVLDNNCQLFSDVFGVHEKDLYGDINLVSGIPFPTMNMEPKWLRFRFLNAAVSRPYLLKIKDSRLNDISQRICRIIATDGGFRKSHIAFPTEGLLIGVGERFEIVCNFSGYSGRTVYFWNDRDTEQMKGVPYFCHSHLIAKGVFGTTTTEAVPPIFQTTQNTPDPLKPIFNVLTTTDINNAMTMANAGQYHREMVFGRTNGHWTINGETWDTAKIAATDVGQNTWEVWKFKTGGGWFHPIHVHLVDFFVLKREREVLGQSLTENVKTYEYLSPKDVFYLGPSQTVYVLARFGAHKGDYMFHCHNLIHEDNDMMTAMRIMNSTQTTKNPTSAQPFIINRLYNLVYNNFKYEDPMLGETSAKPSSLVRTMTNSYVAQTLGKNLYRIFYPTPSDITFMRGARNPWQSQWCPV
jgi:FtsP/CotA-like multicopper oxidase with cupredoxin domain